MPRTSAARRFARLAVQALETRVVPANNLTLVAGAQAPGNVRVDPQGQVVKIFTLKPDAELALETIQQAMSQTTGNGNRPEVIVTTAVPDSGPPTWVDGGQAGDITWDATTAGDLDFTGFVTGRLLTFQTVNDPGATGNIDLTAVGFHNSLGDEQISLKFDTSGPGGAVGFHAGGDVGDTHTVAFDDASVLDLTVTAGTGGYTYEDADFIAGADAGGSISIAAGDVNITHNGGITAFGDVSVAADTVTLGVDAGLLATGSVSVAGTTSVDATGAGLTAENGSVSVTGGAVTLSLSDLAALTSVTVAGTDSVALDTASVFGSGDVSITSDGPVTLAGLEVTPAGNLTVSGTDVQVSDTSLSAVGNLTVTGSGAVTVDGASALGGATVTFTAADPLNISGTDLNATGPATLTGSAVGLDNATYTVGGSLVVRATDPDPTVALSDVTLSAGGDLTLTGAIELGGAAVTVTGTGGTSVVTFGGSMNGQVDLTVAGGTVAFGGAVGDAAPLESLTLARGVADLGVRDLSAGILYLGDGVLDPLGEATLGGKGTVTLFGSSFSSEPGNLYVQQDGNLAPGGVGAVGTLTVQGNVVFDFGDFAVDFGPTCDLLKVRDNPATVGEVEGDVTINVSRLGGGLGTGSLPAGSGDVQLIDFTGTLTGEFWNAPLDTPVIAGTDAVQVTNYGPAAVGLTVAPVAAAPGGVFNTFDPDDGTLVTAKLTGGGQLVGGQIWSGQTFLVARNTTPASVLTITTKANGSDTIATFGAGILVNGPLAALNAPRINIGDQLRATGAVKAAAFRDFFANDPNGANGRIEFGGSTTSTTSITAHNVFGSVQVAGTLTKLAAVGGAIGSGVNNSFLEDSTVTANAIGTITGKSISAYIRSAGKVGTVTATGDFYGGVSGTSLTKLSAGSVFGGSILVNVAGPVTTVVGTGSILNLDLTAASVGSVTVAKGTLQGAVNGWNVTNGIGTLKAAAIAGLDLTARYLGVVSVPGTPDVAGIIWGSHWTLTDNDRTTNHYAIKSLTAAGSVQFSTFDATRGNVGAVKVGRFLSSRLYLNYTPPASSGVGFNSGGAFGADGFKLTSFTTTAAPAAGLPDALRWAYQDSEIAAETIGTVTLSGVNSDNGGVAFGIKEHRSGGVVVVKAADAGFPPSLLNRALKLTDTPADGTDAGNFYFLLS